MRPITFAGMLMFIGPDMALAFGFYEEGERNHFDQCRQYGRYD